MNRAAVVMMTSVVAGLLFTESAFGSPPRVYIPPRGSGSVSNTVVTQVAPGVWDISFTATGSNSATVTVETDAAAVLRNLVVFADGSNTDAQVSVQGIGSNGHWTRVENVTPAGEGELFLSIFTDLDSNNQGGNIGVAGTTPGGLIQAHTFVHLHPAGNVTADIEAIGRVDTGDSNIADISAGGDIIGDLAALSVES